MDALSLYACVVNQNIPGGVHDENLNNDFGWPVSAVLHIPEKGVQLLSRTCKESIAS